MLVKTTEELSSALAAISSADIVALDTETTGLKPWNEDRMFLMSIAITGAEYCFTEAEHWKQVVSTLNINKISAAIHNAKFDLSMLIAANIPTPENFFCTKTAANLLDNNLIPGHDSLDKQARLHFGMEKSDAVKEYCKNHGLFEIVQSETGTSDTKFFFDRVPLDVVVPYAELDAKLCLMLARKQLRELAELDAKIYLVSGKSPRLLYAQETALTRTLVGMEKHGVQVDLDYCRMAMRACIDAYTQAKTEYKKLAGKDFVDSAKSHASVYLNAGLTPPVTEKGNYSFDAEALRSFADPISKVILRYRKAYKKAHTYFENYIKLADKNGRIHCDYNQNVRTGRMSCKDPNLQNIPKRGEDDSDYPTRRAFVPSKDLFLMRDYAACEYRMAFDYAAELSLIEKVNNGYDIHDATKELMQASSRDVAKTINFMLLYGGGIDKLAAELKVSRAEAYALKQRYFSNLPRIRNFISNVVMTAENRGYIVGPYGRVHNFPHKKFSYKAPNALIQGGTADMMKSAMVSCSALLQATRSSLVLSIHDELIFDMAEKDALALTDRLGVLMEQAYKPLNGLPMKSDLEWSDVSLHDRKEWPEFLSVQETRNKVQGARAPRPENNTAHSVF